jgi:lipopolysaccharide export system protein LptC
MIFRGGRLSYPSMIPLPPARASRRIGRSEGDRVFRAAARHSRFVRFLRWAIPAGILITVAVIICATFFNPFRLIVAFPIDPGKISLSGTKIVMELPRLHGFTTDSRPYELTARAAAQDITKPEILELKDINAEVELKDGQRVTIKSINGVYDTKGELLKLNDHIVLNSTSGYEGHLSEASVNVNSGHVVSESPVEVKLPNGLLNANRLEVMENGALILFGGGVEVTLAPDQLQSDSQKSSAASGGPAQVSVSRGALAP